MSRALKNMRMGAKVPKVKNSQVPPLGAYKSETNVPCHMGNSIALPGGNRAKKMKPGNSVALKRK
jgi:hypothetical protein